MALNSYLRLKIDGTDVDTVHGEDNSVMEQGGVDVSTCMEVLFFKAAMDVGVERSHGVRATGHMQASPAEFWVRVGKSTSLLAQALCENSRIDLSLEIYGADHDTGDTLLQFKYEIDQGRIVSFELENPNTLDQETASCPTLIRIAVAGHTFRWISETQGNEYEFNWTTGNR